MYLLRKNALGQEKNVCAFYFSIDVNFMNKAVIFMFTMAFSNKGIFNVISLLADCHNNPLV